MQLRDFPLTFVTFLSSQETFSQIPSTFHAAKNSSVHLPCGRKSLHQLSVLPGEIPSTSSNFPSGIETFCELPSTFGTVGRPSFNFCLLSAWPGDLPLTFVQFPCCREIFRQLALTFCVGETFRQLPLNVRAAGRLSVNFLQLCVQG